MKFKSYFLMALWLGLSSYIQDGSATFSPDEIFEVHPKSKKPRVARGTPSNSDVIAPLDKNSAVAAPPEFLFPPLRFPSFNKAPHRLFLSLHLFWGNGYETVETKHMKDGVLTFRKRFFLKNGDEIILPNHRIRTTSKGPLFKTPEEALQYAKSLKSDVKKTKKRKARST